MPRCTRVPAVPAAASGGGLLRRAGPLVCVTAGATGRDQPDVNSPAKLILPALPPPPGLQAGQPLPKQTPLHAASGGSISDEVRCAGERLQCRWPAGMRLTVQGSHHLHSRPMPAALTPVPMPPLQGDVEALLAAASPRSASTSGGSSSVPSVSCPPPQLRPQRQACTAAAGPPCLTNHPHHPRRCTAAQVAVLRTHAVAAHGSCAISNSRTPGVGRACVGCGQAGDAQKLL